MRYETHGAELYYGDCLEVLPSLPESSVDSILTDPPYGISFMGKEWDHGVPGTPFWEEIQRVARPGAHLLAFGGTRTFHRLACAIEDAGWEIRDCIMWIYGSGFPKSHNISKAIDKKAGAVRKVVGKYIHPQTGKAHGDFRTDNSRSAFSSFEMCQDTRDITAPATDEARKWDGWGTALKPAWEPILLCRKPFKKTIADNVVDLGTGGLNIDDCRVDSSVRPHISAPGPGRWPANLIHDGSEEVVESLPTTPGTGDTSRLFYCAKVSPSERAGSKHPTLKPLSLLRYLCRLITPPNGTVLDPFMGRGSTIEAARLEGFRGIGIEKEPGCFYEACEFVGSTTEERRR